MIDSKTTSLERLLKETIYPVLPNALAAMISMLNPQQLSGLTEIRLRTNQPLLLVAGNQDFSVNSMGKVIASDKEAYLCNQNDIQKTIQLMSKNSLYAFEHQLRMGFLTIEGGHRVGLTGQTILDGGEVKTLNYISGLNIRLAREVKGCAAPIIPYVVTREGQVLNTLIISPPRCGKTTVLRDLIRQISTGSTERKGLQVGVVDERSEIAAYKNGVSLVDLGIRTDVLTNCPKGVGMLMLIRSMSPAVIATDELGRAEDIHAVREAVNAGVNVITTVHGKEMGELVHRPYVKELVESRYFQRYIFLSSNPTVGTVEKVIGTNLNEVLWSK